MADEEPVNPKVEAEEACKPQCVKAWLTYQVGGVRGLDARAAWAAARPTRRPRERAG